MFDIIKPALIRLIIYFVPIVFGLVASWLVANGWGVYDEAAGTYTFTLSAEQIITGLIAMIGAPGLAVWAVIKGWAGFGERPKDQAP